MGRGDIEPVDATAGIGSIRLYNYVQASARHYSDRRGLNQDIIDNDFPAFFSEHNAFESEADNYGVTLGLFLWHPWGRGGNGTDDYQPLPGGDYTTQRLDQILKAEEAGYTWITDGVRANTTPSRTIIYIGSTPVMTMEDAGFGDLIDDGYGFAFDALTTYDEDSEMFQEALALSETNDTLAEANRVDKGLPLVAFVRLWGRPGRVKLEDAPDDSAWWWTSPANDGDWDIDRAAEALANGLRLFVNLRHLSDDERVELYGLVESYVSTGSVASFVPPVHDSPAGCSGAIVAQTCTARAILAGVVWPRFPLERLMRSNLSLMPTSDSSGPHAFLGGDAVEIPEPGPVPQFWVQQGIGFHGGYLGFGGGFLGGGGGNQHGGKLGSTGGVTIE